MSTGEDHYSRLKSEEYILDVTSEFIRGNKDYQLVFQRTVWFFPFRETDNIIYNELMFFQVWVNRIHSSVVPPITTDFTFYKLDWIWITNS